MRPTAYLVVQGSSVIAWWVLLATVHSSRAWFFPGGDISPELHALLLPDVIVLGVMSLAAAWGRSTRRPWAAPVSWLVAGGTSYAALFTFHWSLQVGAPVLSPALMGLLAAGSIVSALQPL